MDTEAALTTTRTTAKTTAMARSKTTTKTTETERVTKGGTGARRMTKTAKSLELVGARHHIHPNPHRDKGTTLRIPWASCAESCEVWVSRADVQQLSLAGHAVFSLSMHIVEKRAWADHTELMSQAGQ